VKYGGLHVYYIFHVITLSCVQVLQSILKKVREHLDTLYIGKIVLIIML
jgi:hypothetical protein